MNLLIYIKKLIVNHKNKDVDTPVNAADSILIFEIMEARSSAGATLIASQCEPEQWYVRSGSELIADSTLSRLTGSARYLELAWPRHAPTQHHTQRRKRMEGSDRRHQRITLSTKRTAGTIHRLPAVPLIGDPITKNDYFPHHSRTVSKKYASLVMLTGIIVSDRMPVRLVVWRG